MSDGTDELDPCPGCDADPCACEPEEQETCPDCGAPEGLCDPGMCSAEAAHAAEYLASEDRAAALASARALDVPEADVRAALAEAIEGAGGVRALARRSGLSPAYVSRAASGKERVAGDLAAFLGFERVTVYRRLP